VTYVIAEPCVDLLDKACIEECPVDCIYEGGRMLYIQPDECVDCAACEPVCLVTAIFAEDDVPAEWKEFTPVNAEFFTDEIAGFTSPGGAAQVGAVDKDHPKVAAWESVG
jgi:ferredoxin